MKNLIYFSLSMVLVIIGCSHNKADKNTSDSLLVMTTIVDCRNEYDSKGKLIRIHKTEVDYVNRLQYTKITETVYSYDGSVLTKEEVYTISDNKKVLSSEVIHDTEYKESIVFLGDDTLDYYKEQFDSGKNVVEVRAKSFELTKNIKDLTSDYLTKTIYDNGKAMKTVTVDYLLNRNLEYLFEYSSLNDTLIEKSTCNDTINRITKKFFDKSKNIQHETVYDGNNIVLHRTEEWMKDGQLNMQVRHSHNQDQFILDTIYYDNGLEIKLVSDGNTFDMVEELEYDSKGSLLRKKTIMTY